MTQYAAGWNAPGYMPMEPPAVFSDPGEAVEYMHDEIADYYDSALEQEDLSIGAVSAATDEYADARHIPGRVLELTNGFPVSVYLPPREGLVFWVQPIEDQGDTDQLHA